MTHDRKSSEKTGATLIIPFQSPPYMDLDERVRKHHVHVQAVMSVIKEHPPSDRWGKTDDCILFDDFGRYYEGYALRHERANIESHSGSCHDCQFALDSAKTYFEERSPTHPLAMRRHQLASVVVRAARSISYNLQKLYHASPFHEWREA